MIFLEEREMSEGKRGWERVALSVRRLREGKRRRGRTLGMNECPIRLQIEGIEAKGGARDGNGSMAGGFERDEGGGGEKRARRSGDAERGGVGGETIEGARRRGVVRRGPRGGGGEGGRFG